jgi:hypothetical protein
MERDFKAVGCEQYKRISYLSDRCFQVGGLVGLVSSFLYFMDYGPSGFNRMLSGFCLGLIVSALVLEFLLGNCPGCGTRNSWVRKSKPLCRSCGLDLYNLSSERATSQTMGQ